MISNNLSKKLQGKKKKGKGRNLGYKKNYFTTTVSVCIST